MLDDITLLCRLVLAGVFLVSGASKLTDRQGTRDAVAAFGIPPVHAARLAYALPLAELAVAAALLPGSTAGPAAAAALLLLTAFTAGVGWNLFRGNRPECHCFGRLGSSDISGRTVVRNLLLAGLAVTVMLTPAAGAGERVTSGSAGALASLVLATVTLVALLIGGEAWLARRAFGGHTTGPGSRFAADLADGAGHRGPAPRFVLPTLDGPPVALADLLDGRRPLLLTFLSPGCGPCRRLRPAVSRWAEVFCDRLAVAAVVSGDAEANRRAFGEAALPVLLDEDRAVAQLYDIPSRPCAVVVGRDGTLLGPLAAGDREVRALLRALLSGSLERQQRLDEVPAETLSLQDAPRPRATVTMSREPGAGATILTDEATGETAALDPVGALVWQCLDGQTPLSQIVDELAEAFAAPPQVVGADVVRMVQSVGGLGLLEGVAADQQPHAGAEPQAAAAVPA